jgi:hypothetical protein
MEVILSNPSGQRITVGKADDSAIKDALENARADNLPYAGVILRSTFTPLRIPAYGLYTAIVNVDGQEHVCAILNIKPNPSATSSPSSSPSQGDPLSSAG